MNRNRNLTHAERKRVAKAFKKGDVVTWGRGICSHVVVEVRETGLLVDVTSRPDARHYAQLTPDGRRVLFVTFDGNNRNHGGRGPIRHSTLRPDGDDATILALCRLRGGFHYAIEKR